MADLGFVINTAELPEAKDFSPLPAGDYDVMIVNSKLMPTNDTKKLMQAAGVAVDQYEVFRKTNPNAPGYLALEMDVQSGASAGRKLFHNLNLINDNAQAREIAAGQLKQILEAFGMKTFSGKSEELHNKRLGISVKVEVGKPYQKDGQTVPGNPQNKVTKFYAAGTATQSRPVDVVASGGAAPWARK